VHVFVCVLCVCVMTSISRMHGKKAEDSLWNLVVAAVAMPSVA